MKPEPLRFMVDPRAAVTCMLASFMACDCSRPVPEAHAPPPENVHLDMVPVPAATFAMGSNDGDDDERPVHDVHVASFSIGRTEVTVAQYRACVARAACTAPSTANAHCNYGTLGRDEHPVNCVTWAQASAFCAWAGARLPNEIEWEYAARGVDGRRYPWGDSRPAAQLCWDGPGSDLGLGKRKSTCPVGSYPTGASPFGALDMAGNVWEWTADAYSESYASPPDPSLRVTRGGTWFGYDTHDVRATLRFRVFTTAQNYGLGFRCAR